MYMRMPRTCLRLCGKKGYEGYDPERNTFDSGTNYYPTPRIFTFGINLNF